MDRVRQWICCPPIKAECEASRRILIALSGREGHLAIGCARKPTSPRADASSFLAYLRLGRERALSAIEGSRAAITAISNLTDTSVDTKLPSRVAEFHTHKITPIGLWGGCTTDHLSGHRSPSRKKRLSYPRLDGSL